MANLGEARNKFQKHDDIRAAEKKAVVKSAEERESIRQSQRESWVASNRSGRAGVGIGGTVLDEKTVAARTAAAMEKQATPNGDAPIPVSLNQDDLEAIFEGFLRQRPEFYDTPLNRQNLFNCVLANIRKLTGFNIESLNQAFGWLRANGYFERPNQHRGLHDAGRAAKVYEYEPVEAPVEVPVQKARVIYSREIPRDEYQQLQEMDFNTLAKKARGRK